MSKEEKGINLHLHGYVKKTGCPYKVKNDYELSAVQTLILLSRAKIDSNDRIDVKFYYNCIRASGCDVKECMFQRGALRYER